MTAGWGFSQVLHSIYILNGDPSKEIKRGFDSLIIVYR